ncbi:MAG: TonB-dependent receptor, partial [Muribaculaceae bacterium]|nr:TonB-dependent receptor [Muribaculaceae bacterium]
RISSRVAADYQAKKWLKVGGTFAYNHVKSGWPSGQDDGGTAENAFGFCDAVAPVYPIYVRNADGSIMRDPRNGLPVYDYGDGKYAQYRNADGDIVGTNRMFMSGGNAASSFIYDSADILMDILNTKWYATITPIDNLNITGNIGYFLDNTRQHIINNPWYGASEVLGGFAEQVFSRTRGLNLQALASYRHTVADVHHLDYLLGYESYDLNAESLVGYGYGLYNPNSWAVSNTLKEKRQLSGGNPTNYTTRGIFGRINYDYDSKYFASVSYRRDASSRFAPDKRWGNFYSLSAAWDMSNEKFLQSAASWLDLLKLKFSFGQQGNDNIGNYYAYVDQYSISGETAWSDGSLHYKGNPDITWETSNALNAGVDFSFFQGKLAGTVEYFQRQTSDMLYRKPVAPSLGYEYFPMNVGSMKNYGIELEVNYRPIANRHITWEINANLTWIRNKILKLTKDVNGQIISGMTIWKEGESRYNYYLVDYAGVNPENGEPLYWTHDPILDAEGNATGAYTAEYLTNNYDHAYANNRKESGNNLPPVYGGFGTTLKFYGFDFGIQFSYQVGGRTFDNQYGRLMHQGQTTSLGTNFHTDMLNSWTPENRYTNIPKLDTQASYDLGGQWTTFNLVSSNYLSLNNITLGYTLAAKSTTQLGIA